MGLNVGGIHVKVRKGVTQRAVTKRIASFWTALGARLVEADPLEVQPLSLAKTGDLGFAVLPALDAVLPAPDAVLPALDAVLPAPDADGGGAKWIPVYDSERYTADPALARDLAIHFKTQVWHWEFHDATSGAYAKRYGPEEMVVRGSAVEETIGALPGALLYFNKLRTDLPEEALALCQWLRFADVPHRPKAKYSGPSQAQLQSNQGIEGARRLAAERDAKALLSLAQDPEIYHEVILPSVRRSNLEDQDQLAYVLALAPLVLAESGHNRVVAEAALRAGEEELFAEAMEKLASYEAGLVEHQACRLGEKGEHRLAFRLLEAVTRLAESSQTAWTNALYYYLRVMDDPGLPKERLEALLTGAERAGPTNPAIFHNLACTYARLGRHDETIEAVRSAKTHGYEKMDALARDDDLAPIAGDPRLTEALEADVGGGMDHLVIERGYRGNTQCIVRPALGLHLYFAVGPDTAPRVADLMAQIREDFPEMFTCYRPSGILGMEKTPKGKPARDITALRKNKAAYGYMLQYDDAMGQATERRFRFDCDDEEGELSIYLPCALAEDPDALFERLLGYASLTPFQSGCAGYTLCPFDHGNVVGPSTDAEDEIGRLAPMHRGLALSPAQHGCIAADVVNPSWLTFLDAAKTSALPKGFRGALGTATARDLPHGALLIRAREAPFVGRGSAPKDLGALPAVVRTLAPLWPTGENGWGGIVRQRIDSIAALP